MVLVGSPHLPTIWREYPRIVQKDKPPSYPVLHIAETYVQLVATKATCYSTSWSALLESVLVNVPTLYCVVSYIAACVDVSRTVFRDRSLKKT